VKLKPRAENYQPSFEIKKHLNLANLIRQISDTFREVPDVRRKTHCLYQQHDVMMAALSCMFFQEPSWLQFQQHLQEGLHDNNLSTLFHIKDIPKDPQVRDILDSIDSEHYRLVFKQLFEQLRRGKQLERFRTGLANGLYYVSVDGSGYHSSKTVHCECCLTKKHKNGTTTYQHQVLQGAIMHPDCRQVIPLMPEPIINTDGKEKQDCEHSATKRFLTQLKKDHPHLPLLIGGDGLFSDGTITRYVISLGMHYLFTCKPGDHTFLMEWLDGYKEWPWIEEIEYIKKGKERVKRIHRYRWRNDVPLSAQSHAPQVNYLEYEQITDGKVNYHNSWVTDLDISQSNIFELIKTGRCRWKVENECFNSLKNQGYNMKHNFGHGKQHLAHNMYLSILLAFTLHQIMELCDDAYQQCRARFGSKRNLWERIRQVLCMFIVPDWYWLFDWCLDPKHERFMLVDD
jgi:hypothetical protein